MYAAYRFWYADIYIMFLEVDAGHWEILAVWERYSQDDAHHVCAAYRFWNAAHI